VSAHPDIEALEALAMGKGAAESASHVEQCAECAREVAWLRAERALIARRPAVKAGHLWAGIEQRISRNFGDTKLNSSRLSRFGRVEYHVPAIPHWARRIGVGAASVAAAAAVVLIFLRTRPPQIAQQPGGPSAVASQSGDAPKPREEYRPDPKTLAALDRAEADYRDAAKILEAEYDRMRPHLDPKLAKRWDETLTRAHTQLGEARAVAGNDVNARMQVLDGYAGYLRSLRNVVQQTEEVTP
jgi:hypothetical protein